MTNTIISIEAENRARQNDLERIEWERKQADKNPPFFQLDKTNFRPYRELARRAPAAWQVLNVLVEKMNRQNAIACSQKTLAKISGYNIRTVKRAIDQLEKEQWIQVIKFGTANAYVINSSVFWQTTREGRFAVFHAAIIADAEEQNTNPEDWNNIKLKHVPVLHPGETLVLTGNDDQQKELDL